MLLRRLGLFLIALVTAAALAASGLATISSALNKTIVAGNGSQTAFTFPFVGVAAGDISVTYTTAAGVATVLANGPGPTQYQLALNAAVAPALWGLGGTVTYNPSGTPIASGSTLTIVRTLPYVQLTSLQNQASFGQLAQATEQALDQLAMQIQQVSEAVTRVLQAPISDPAGVNLTLPPAAQRANTGLAFDGSGNVIAGTTPSTGTISSAMQPVVNAASVAAGRSALGLASMSQEAINGGTCGGASLQDDGSGNARVVLATAADAVSQSVTCAFHLQQRIATGPITYTLARANTLFNGFGFWVLALPGTGAVTLAPNAADNFPGYASGTSVALQPGAWAWVSTNAANSGAWYARYAPSSGIQPTRCVIVLTGATTCNNGGAQANNGTYTTPVGVTRLNIREAGGGGGGGGNGNTVGTAGGNGADTSFNSIVAAHGVGGGTNSNTGLGGSGGAGGTGGAGTASLRIAGGPGGGGTRTDTDTVGIGGIGGASCFGGPGAPTVNNSSGGAGAAAAGYGSGGAGASTSGSTGVASAGGGGGAECAEFTINNPGATYSYAVGTAGAGGAQGSGGVVGGAGKAGIIIVDEFYNFLLKRDLGGAANDNSPMWLDAAA